MPFQTAEATLRASAGIGVSASFHVSLLDSEHPLTDAYTELILNLKPFQHRFKQAELEGEQTLVSNTMRCTKLSIIVAVRKLLAGVAPGPTTPPQVPAP